MALEAKAQSRRESKSGSYMGEEQVRQREPKSQRPGKGAGLVCSCIGRAVVAGAAGVTERRESREV